MHCPLLRWNGLYIRKIKSQLALKPNHLTCIAIVSTSFTRKQGEQRPTSNNHLNQREREGRIRGRLDGRNRLEPSLRETKTTPYNNSKIPNEIVSLIGRPSMKKREKLNFNSTIDMSFSLKRPSLRGRREEPVDDAAITNPVGVGPDSSMSMLRSVVLSSLSPVVKAM